MEYENNKYRFSHDITHCGGGRCDKKEHCLRYLAYKEIEKDGGYYSFAKIDNPSKCELYVNVNIKKIKSYGN